MALLVLWLSLVGFLSRAETCPEPVCVKRADQESIELKVSKSGFSEQDILARLIFAEGISTGYSTSPKCTARKNLILEAIAWGVMNRIQLTEQYPELASKYGRGIRGVVFKKGQFNPAVSTRSPFSDFFLCPTAFPEWKDVWCPVQEILPKVTAKDAKNPFIQTDWEKKKELSLVTQFYYPLSKQATPQPPKWADVEGPRFVRKLSIQGQELDRSCIWFFRSENPPKD